MTESYLLGMKEKLTINGQVYGNVKDVTINLSTGETDITTRNNDGWRASAPTLKECSIDFTMLDDPSDSGFNAIKSAWENNSTIDVTTAAVSGKFVVIDFKRNEPLEEAVTWDVTLKYSGASTTPITPP